MKTRREDEEHGAVALVGAKAASKREQWVKTLVQAGAVLMLPSSMYRQYHDVILPTAGGTTQIDHVFVSVFGVFVVETKNMSGWIFGSERDQDWTQVFPGGRKFKFQNPLRQNYGPHSRGGRRLGKRRVTEWGSEGRSRCSWGMRS